jgi:UPF0755 protein
MTDSQAKTAPPRRSSDTPRIVSPAERTEPTRPPPRPRRSLREERATRLSPAFRAINATLTVLAFVLISIVGFSFWFSQEVDKPGQLTEARPFIVKRGEGVRDIAQRLAEDGVIPSQHLFVAHYLGRYIGTWFGAKPLQLKAGEYDLQPQASIAEIAEVLGEGKSVLARITIPEGLTSAQIVERIKADRNLTGEVTAIPPEGVLMPDTYKFSRGMTRVAFLDLMAAEGRKFLEAAWAARPADTPLKSPEETLVLASIVEKETGRNDERSKVAAVFVNRIRQGMRLQSDPTILYGLFGGQVQWGRPIYRSEIQQKTAHNTYQIDGLPPTPICNPGRNAILAVLAPAKTNDLFFVADGQGGHVFTQNLKDHNAAVANWRKVEKEIRAREAVRASARAADAAKSAGPVAAPSSSAGPGVRASDATAEDAPPPTSPPAAQDASPPAVQPSEQPQPAAASADVPLPTRKPKR